MIERHERERQYAASRGDTPKKNEQESKARWPHHSRKVHAEMRRRPCAITASALDTTRVIAPFVEISRKHLEPAGGQVNSTVTVEITMDLHPVTHYWRPNETHLNSLSIEQLGALIAVRRLGDECDNLPRDNLPRDEAAMNTVTVNQGESPKATVYVPVNVCGVPVEWTLVP